LVIPFFEMRSGGVIGVDVHIVEREVASVDAALEPAEMEIDHDFNDMGMEALCRQPNIISAIYIKVK
jgi:hypothetical protein